MSSPTNRLRWSSIEGPSCSHHLSLFMLSSARARTAAPCHTIPSALPARLVPSTVSLCLHALLRFTISAPSGFPSWHWRIDPRVTEVDGHGLMNLSFVMCCEKGGPAKYISLDRHGKLQSHQFVPQIEHVQVNVLT
jgi:hypothetical protein